MTANSPVTMDELVNGLKFSTGTNYDVSIVKYSGRYVLYRDSFHYNPVSLSSDGLTITFGDIDGGPDLLGFIFYA